jgi:hypothetical protein
MRRVPSDGRKAVVQGLPDAAQAAGARKVAADGAGRLRLVAKRQQRRPAAGHKHGIIDLDREPIVRHTDEHLASASLFRLLIAGAGDVSVLKRGPEEIQLDPVGGQSAGRRRMRVLEDGE